jgi:hypothetical protein
MIMPCDNAEDACPHTDIRYRAQTKFVFGPVGFFLFDITNLNVSGK